MVRRSAFGDWLRAWREEQGLTQRELAEQMRYEPSGVAHFETGRKPSADLVLVLEFLYGVKWGELQEIALPAMTHQQVERLHRLREIVLRAKGES